MLSETEIGTWHLDNPFRVPSIWNLSRKHFRISLSDCRFVKLNHFESRLNERDLRFYCYKLRPMHAYFSVLNWLFPERVGRKYKAEYCIPLNGEYVIDVDSYLVGFRHVHKVDDHWFVCPDCLDMAKRIALQLCEIIHKYYRKIAIVFSGCAGFHVHVMDFNYYDWVHYHWNDPLWDHSAARFKFSKLLQKQTRCFDRAHFTVSVDPVRVATVPNTLNGKTGLVCKFIGTPKDLELLTIDEVLEMSKAFPVHRYPEALENSPVDGGGNGSMKSCAKNMAEAA